MSKIPSTMTAGRCKRVNEQSELTLCIYYYIIACMSGRTILWRNIQLENGSSGPTEGKNNTQSEYNTNNHYTSRVYMALCHCAVLVEMR